MANLERIEEIKALVKEKEDGIIQEYISLGKLYFNIHKDDEMQMFKDVNDILQLQAEIRELEDELSTLQNEAETEIPYTPSPESKPVADFYPEDSKIAKSEFLYREIFGSKADKEVPLEAAVEETSAEENSVSATALDKAEEIPVEETPVAPSFETPVEETPVAPSFGTPVAETPETPSFGAPSNEPVSNFVTFAEENAKAIALEEELNKEVSNEAEEISEDVSIHEEVNTGYNEVSEENVSDVISQNADSEGNVAEEVASEPEKVEEVKDVVVNPFLQASNNKNTESQAESKKEEYNPDKTETFSSPFRMNGNDDVDDETTEILSNNLFEDEKTYILKDNFAGFGNDSSIAQDAKTVPQNPYRQPMNGQPFSQQPQQMNQGYQGSFNARPYGGPQNGYQQNGYQQNGYQQNPYQSPFGNESGKTTVLNAYAYQQPQQQQSPFSQAPMRQADSAIDNEATMILDGGSSRNDAQKMQPNGSSGNKMHCPSCGKDAPSANFCIFCGAKMK